MSEAEVARLTAEVAELRAALARLGLIQAEALNAIAEITRAEASLDYARRTRRRVQISDFIG